jgi:hypothetical protein
MIYPAPFRSASVAALLLIGCGEPAAPAPAPAAPTAAKSASPAAPAPAPAAPTAAKSASFDWPVPEKWKHETIPFPLDFAPELPYRGTEELRFAPGFFDPNAPGYWSYAFVWFVDSGPAFDTASVSSALKQYFVGLTRAVAKESKKPFEPDLSKIGVHLDAQMNGTLTTVDAFTTHAPVLLTIKTTKGECGDHRYLLVAASPKPAGDPMWESLGSVASSYKCH